MNISHVHSTYVINVVFMFILLFLSAHDYYFITGLEDISFLLQFTNKLHQY